MFRWLSIKITKWLIDCEVILPEDKEIYQYGLQQALVTLINIGSTVLLGVIFDRVFEGVLFMLAYIPLRSYAGGVHARNSMRCFWCSIVLMSAVLLVMKYVPYVYLVNTLLTILAGIIVWYSVPVENLNKRLNEVETIVYRRKARKILVLEMVISLLANMLYLKRVGKCMTLVICVMTIMLLLGKWKKRSTCIL